MSMKLFARVGVLVLSAGLMVGCGMRGYQPLKEGIYRFDGGAPGPDGALAQYTGAAEIKRDPSHKETFNVAWVLDAQPDRLNAFGLGYEHNGLFVVIIRAGDSFELASYAIEGNQLLGKWVDPGASDTFPEHMVITTETSLVKALKPTSAPTRHVDPGLIRASR